MKNYVVRITIQDGENEYYEYFISQTRNIKKLQETVKNDFFAPNDYREVKIDGYTEIPKEELEQVKAVLSKYVSIYGFIK